MESKGYSNPYGTYDTGYENFIVEHKDNKNIPPTQQPTPPPENNESIQIKIDKKGKGHEKNQSMNYGFIGSTSSNKYSNPYDNNVYGEFVSSSSKKEKGNNKKANKKRASNEQILSDVDVTQAPVNASAAAVAVGAPVVYYTAPTVGTPVATAQQIATVPTVYYTTPVATPVAIQYVNSPNLGYQEGSNSSKSELNKEKGEGRKYISYFADKENVEEDIVKSNDKEKEYQEIMNELGIKPKDKEPKDLKSRILRNQLAISITLLILFVILIILYFVYPRVPDISVKEFTLQEQNAIQYKFPMSVEYREEYIDLNNVTSSDVDSFMRFNLITHFDVRNNNYLPYKFKSLNLDYVLKSEFLKNNVFLGRSFVESISFSTRKNTRMTITTTLEYSSQSMKKDDTFRYLLEKCGITGPGSKMDLDYKVTMKIPVVSIMYHPSYTKSTQFECPFLIDEKFKIIEKKKEDKKDDDDEDNKNDDSKKNDDDDGNKNNDGNNYQ
ncbi:hypothetical protein BCR36DRAFT_317547 [Piromyces finnis]|uniref:Late embryogenesis abundant protein LEA-2 subgroup domain-containing protein n=1 Tax=Piromyces finnis TaxID=1754191 RepID=A0A1Y1VKS1_9FUNG|nr:hypothetical protein BCR36DRAFT_317547 [Piromyces finnis]|eukprot:ORX58349.1 hypothetical protein BCR36DRAFT_317547 [Piromyces finnis]